MPINNDIKCIAPATTQYHADSNDPNNTDFGRNFDLARNCSNEIASNVTSTATTKNGDGEQPVRFRRDESSSPQVGNGVINNVFIDSNITVKHTSSLTPMSEAPIKDGAFGIHRVESSAIGNTDAQKILGKDSRHLKNTHTNPAAPHTLRQTKDLAMKQTMDGRRVLYSPGEALIKELSTAASVLHRIVSNLSADSQITIGARVLGEEGLLDGKTIADLLAALKRVSTKKQIIQCSGCQCYRQSRGDCLDGRYRRVLFPPRRREGGADDRIKQPANSGWSACARGFGNGNHAQDRRFSHGRTR
ncbi:hypothetical protein [Pseudomonas putida]|uniref:hypothetical protein n=1 Tax=Pseudomonas putida TaxID=303 RepID=UPI001E49E446|nr:hypothetical protein [Pseudomonas putida]MCC9008585.1 hypothetical protein [Pseudomonas putida]